MVTSKRCFCFLFIALFAKIRAAPREVIGSKASLLLSPTTDGIQLELLTDDTAKLVGTIGIGTDFSGADCIGEEACVIGNVLLGVQTTEGGFQITWETKSSTVVFKDCYDLMPGELNWFGGPERYYQEWPIEKLTLSGDDAYIIRKTDNFAVAERYWLNSAGAYIFIDDRAPLFIDQNNSEEGKVCFIAKLADPYINRERILFAYTIAAKDDAKEAHLHAINNYLGKPTGHPDANMVKQPIWTTWAKYKKAINDEVVLSFAQDIIDHGFKSGQLEIDDDWERCYGAQEFKSNEFADIANTVTKLKEMDFRVTLWIHPFVNNDCEDRSSDGLENGYFVKNTTGSTAAVWWDGTDANQIDFTNAEAAEWFSARLKKLQNNPAIDSFKFDAGETNYAPQPSVYNNVDVEKIPNVLTESYIRTVSAFGNIIETRSAWRTQDLPMFTRMIDKDSHWGSNNGLYTLVTTLLQMNMNGYPMVLPDMIGGNGYDIAPTVELLIRWTQANAFMPAMQFSYLPWDYTADEDNGVAIIQKYVQLHEDYSEEIIKAMEASIETGAPVNPPIWWVSPTDPIALATADEFLLGESILVAPVLEEGATSRNIYLPVGSWKYGNGGDVYEGPIALTDFPAPLDTLPYFIKQ